MAKHGQAGEYGNELGLHHAREEMLEALEMLHRLHRGDLKALVPEIHYRHLRGRLPAAVENAGANRGSSFPPWFFMTNI